MRSTLALPRKGGGSVSNTSVAVAVGVSFVASWIAFLPGHLPLVAIAIFSVVLLSFVFFSRVREKASNSLTEKERRRDAESLAAALAYEIAGKKVLLKQNEDVVAIVDATPDFIMTVDAFGRVLFMNEASRQFFGEQEIGPDSDVLFSRFHRFDAVPTLREGFLEASLVGSWHGESVVINRANAVVPVSVALVAHQKSEAEGIVYTFVMRDMMVQKDLEERLRAAIESERTLREEAEDASRVKDEFLQILSHELRTPMTPIMGWVAMIRNGVCSEEDRNKAIDIIARNASSQLRLINDLLEMSRIVTGKIALDVSAVDLEAIVTESVEVVQLAANAKGIEVVLDLSSEPVVLQADAARIKQVLWNLMANAVKFTQRKGRIVVRTRLEKSMVVIDVCDNGMGIEKAFLPHVFDRFRQSDTSATRKHGGLGLGLAIAKSIVELHGGEIAVRSEGLNKGTTFSISLPVAAVFSLRTDELPLPAETTECLARLDGLKLLVVDNEPDTLVTLEMALRAQGAEVVPLLSSLQAEAALLSGSYDALVSDVNMPEMDGLDLIGRLRAREQGTGAHLPAVALTALASVRNYDECLAAGFDAHLAKPCEISVLVRAIHDVRRKRARARREPVPP